MEENNQHTEVVSPLELAVFINDCQRGKDKAPFRDLTVRTFKTFEFRFEQRPGVVATVFQFLHYAETIQTHLN